VLVAENTRHSSTGALMDRLARLVTRRARAVLLVSTVLLLLAAVAGSGVFGSLKSQGFDDPSAESSRGAELLEERFGVEQTDLVVLVTAEAGDVDSPAVADAARELTAEAAAEQGVTVLASYWQAPPGAAEGLRSADGRSGLLLLALSGTDEQAEVRAEELEPLLTRDLGPATAATGGLQQANLDINAQVESDLAVAEAIAVPLTIALLLVVFGSVVAGLLPLLVGLVAIVGTFAALAAVASFTDVSVFALNLTTAMGIGLGVDYALLVVSRYREELARGADAVAAVTITLRTAGRTILFSAATVAVALSALLVFPLYFLRSFAYAGIAVVVAATLAALVALPALLVALGPARLEKGSVGWLRRRTARATARSAGWARLAHVVMRRPLLTATPVVLLLTVMALPLTGVQFGVPDDRALRTDVQARQVGDVLREGFATQDSAALQVVLQELRGDVAGYAAATSRLEGVARTASPAGVFVDGARVAEPVPGTSGSYDGGAWLTVVPDLDPNSAAAERLVDELRSLDAPGQALVTGPSAFLVDGKDGITDRLWLAGLLIATTTFVLLFLFTGSVLLPLKALVLNLLTLGGVLGAMVWVFQHGNGADLLGFTPTPITTAMPVLLFCIAFGLSMDYEVFLLGRIKEAHDSGLPTREAVAVGLERTGRIVTMAAVLLSITFFAFTTSGVSFIQFFGLGTGLAIVLDATLVRGVLVPALMRVMGEANWWAPAPLRRLHDRFGLAEAPEPVALPAPREERVPAGV
jgi:putative drug exporter of the RND superfamily